MNENGTGISTNARHDPLFVFGSWNGGVYFDRWMIVHIVGGLAIGVILRSVGAPALVALALAAVLLSAWEGFEAVRGLYEHLANRVLDVVFGLGGVALAYTLIPELRGSGALWLTIFLLLLWSGLSLWGWYEWQKRKNFGE